MNSDVLSFSQTVKAAPAETYRMFTNGTALREWLCDVATLAARPGGRLYLAWNPGYFASGEFTEVQPKEKLAFAWQGRGDPAQTQVEVTFVERDGSTLVNLEHSGLGSGEDWSHSRAEIERGWRAGLENLASVMDSGEDLRLVRRPMVGILQGDFNEEAAKALGTPVTEGIRLDDVIEGMGAQAAGLQKDDVLVSLAGKPLTDYTSLANTLQGLRGGDKVEVIFYRGPEKKTLTMELSRRPIPEIPRDAHGLAEGVRKISSQVLKDLESFLAGITDEEASFKIAADEWSLKEVIAHFIQDERYTHHFIAELVFSEERVSDGYGDNFQPYIEATVKAYPTLKDLLQEYQRSSLITLEILEGLPEKFVQRKSSFWRLSYNLLQDPYHYFSHKDQMQAAVDAARVKA
jgi:uncharacterized protein YndB with AHSA1/START domain